MGIYTLLQCSLLSAVGDLVISTSASDWLETVDAEVMKILSHTRSFTPEKAGDMTLEYSVKRYVYVAVNSDTFVHLCFSSLCFCAYAIMLLTPLFKGSVVPNKGPRYQGRTFTGAREQFWPDALPAATNDSYGYQRELNAGLLSARLPL